MNHVLDKLQAYLDDELAADEKRQVADHCRQCLRCRRERDRLSALWQTVDDVAPARLERSLWPGVESRLRGTASRHVGSRRAGPATTWPGWRGGIPWQRWFATTGLASGAVAAGLVLGLMVGAPELSENVTDPRAQSRAMLTLVGDTAMTVTGEGGSELDLNDDAASFLTGTTSTLAELWAVLAVDEGADS